MAELKPCPFCGGIATTRVSFSQLLQDRVTINFSVICTRCGVDKTAHLQVGRNSDRCFRDFENALDEVSKAWNRRAGEDG